MADVTGVNPFASIDTNMPSPPSNSGWAQQLFASNPFSNRYNFTPLNYQAPSFSSGPSIANSLIPSSVGGSSTSAGNGSNGGFLSGIGNFFKGIGNDIYNGYEKTKGALEGLATGSFLLDDPTVTQGASGNGTPWSLGNVWNHIAQGWSNPQQMQSTFSQGLSNLTDSLYGKPNTQPQLHGIASVLNPLNNAASTFDRFAPNFTFSAATDPLTYVPVGTIAKATGITPALKFGYDWAKGAVKGADATATEAPNIAKSLPTMFDHSNVPNPASNVNAPSLSDLLNYKENPFTNVDIPNQEVNAPSLSNMLSAMQKIAPSVYRVSNPAENQLQQLFNIAKKSNLPPGREYEALKDMWSSMAPKDAGNLDSLIEASTQTPRNISQIAQDINARKAFGIYPQLPIAIRNMSGELRPNLLNNADSLGITSETPPLAELLQNRNAGDFINGTGGHGLNTSEEAPSLAQLLQQSIHEAAPTAENVATGVTKAPYAAYNWQSALGKPIANALTKVAPDGVPIVRNLIDNKFTQQLGKNFIKFYGASPAVADSLREMTNAKGADLQNIVETMRNLAQAHGLNESEMQDVVHMFEGLPVSNTRDKVTQAYNDLKGVLENGISTPNGNALGTQAELNTIYNGKPLLENLRDNYYPHQYNESVVDKLLNSTKSNAKVFSTKGASNNERVFDTVLDAQQAGFKPEMNPYVAIGQRLAESSQKIRNAEALNRILDSGALSDEAKSGLVPSTIPQLMGKHMTQGDLDALKQYMSPRNSGEFMKLYDKGMSGWKQASVMNSLVHGHNVVYNGGWLGGANPSYVLETLKNLAKKNDDEWFQKALRAGAVSSDRGQFLDNLKGAIKNTSSPIRDKISYAWHGALWDLDKALRTAIFRDAVEKGATESEAAAKANKFLTNYNNLTPFEERFMTRIFPFYRWMKGNMPLQVEQWLNNTPKQMLYEHAKNAMNQALTGQDIGDDGKIDTGIVLSDGSHVKVDPYAPADDPIKALRDGIVPFLYGKQNPILKELETQGTNHAYYPEAMYAPNGKESMANTLIRNPGAPSSDNIRATISHIANNLNPLSGGALGNVVDAKSMTNNLMGVNNNKLPKPPQTAAEIITRLLGGFPSRDNPALDNYYQQKDAQQHIKDQISYMKKQGQAIPKAINQQAYKKIPFPIAGQ